MTTQKNIRKFCTECGAEIIGEHKFCTECGAVIKEPEMKPTNPPPVLTLHPPPPRNQQPPPPQNNYQQQQPRNNYQQQQQPRNNMYQNYNNPQPTYNNNQNSQKPLPGSPYEPISTWGFIGIYILMILPLIGLILTIVWACGGCTKVNKQNMARANLILIAVGFVLTIILGLALRSVFIDLFSILGNLS